MKKTYVAPALNIIYNSDALKYDAELSENEQGENGIVLGITSANYDENDSFQ